MPPLSEEDEYDTNTQNFKNVNGDGTTSADTDLVVQEVTHKAQLSNIVITGANSEIYDVVARDQDGSNSTVIATLVGSSIDKGSFEEPFIRNIGANREVAVINRSQLNDANYGVYIEVDELRKP
jgi:hypothetical protein